ncbi:hypothetical protein [Kordiimonas sp.]|uniref:hypothetical protein n=1 Tax=Kordiimonas sp. TaxID=1970157 RepID=UPI003A8F3933
MTAETYRTACFILEFTFFAAVAFFAWRTSRMSNDWRTRLKDAEDEARRCKTLLRLRGEVGDELDKLQRFKRYVHLRLDSEGVPAEPGNDSECRVGARLDWVFERFEPDANVLRTGRVICDAIEVLPYDCIEVKGGVIAAGLADDSGGPVFTVSLDAYLSAIEDVMGEAKSAANEDTADDPSPF